LVQHSRTDRQTQFWIGESSGERGHSTGCCVWFA